MHNAYTAEKHDSAGKFLLKKPSYRVKKANEEFELYINKSTERIVYVRRIHIQHWVLKGIEAEFKANCLNKWNAHSVNITNIAVVRRNYTILAECSKGPIIVEHNNTLAAQFTVDPNYPETVKMLKNFVRKKVADLTEQPKQANSANYRHPTHKFAAKYAQLYSDNPLKLYTEKFFHSGWSYSKRHGIYITKNNAISEAPLKLNVTYTRRVQTANRSPSMSSGQNKFNRSAFKREASAHYKTVDRREHSWDKEGLNLKTRASDRCRPALAGRKLRNGKRTSGHTLDNPYNEFTRNGYVTKHRAETASKNGRYNIKVIYGFAS